jgi:hypothetical protein
MKQVAFSLAIAMLLVGVTTARGEMIYSTLGAADSFDLLNGWVVDSANNAAVPFTVTGSNYSFTSVDLALYRVSGSMNVLLMSDSNGLPGAVIETLAVPISADLTTATSVLNPILTNGTTYWISTRGIGNYQGGWNWTSPQLNGPFAFTFNGGASWISLTDKLPAVRVNGDPIASPVPEPGSLTLALLGVLSLAGLTRRKWATAVR